MRISDWSSDVCSSDLPVRPDVAAFLAFLNAQDGPKMEELPPAAAREVMRALGRVADVPRGAIAHVEDRVIPGPAGDIPIRIYDSRPGRETEIGKAHV